MENWPLTQGNENYVHTGLCSHVFLFFLLFFFVLLHKEPHRDHTCFITAKNWKQSGSSPSWGPTPPLSCTAMRKNIQICRTLRASQEHCTGTGAAASEEHLLLWV